MKKTTPSVKEPKAEPLDVAPALSVKFKDTAKALSGEITALLAQPHVLEAEMIAMLKRTSEFLDHIGE